MRFLPISLALLVAASSAWGAEEKGETLADQLRLIAQQQGFTLVGAEKAADSPAAKPPGGDPVQQVKILLAGYDYVAIQPPDGKLQKIILLGRKNSAPTPAPAAEAPKGDGQTAKGDVVIPTERRDAHHLVLATVHSDAGAELQTSLMVDTGASLVVLPKSALGQLNIPADQLQEREVQTAKGKMKASAGRAPMVQIGPLEVPNVEVAFIDDELLGEHALLGMNVLGRYRFTLDDKQNTLTLSPKRK